MVKKTTSMRSKAVFEGKGLVTTWRSCGSSAAIVMSQVWRTRIAINIPSSPCVFLIVSRVVIVAVASIWLNNWIIWQKFYLFKKIYLNADQFKSPQFAGLQRWSFPNLLHDVHLLDYGRFVFPQLSSYGQLNEWPIEAKWENKYFFNRNRDHWAKQVQST